jgi:hypothetical protein
MPDAPAVVLVFVVHPETSPVWHFGERAEREARRFSRGAAGVSVLLLTACAGDPARVQLAADDDELGRVDDEPRTAARSGVGSSTIVAAGAPRSVGFDEYDALAESFRSSDGPRTGLGDAIESVPPWGSEESRSWIIPAAEIVVFEFLLNQYDRHYVNEHEYDTDWDSIEDNLDRGTVIDDDPFRMNQFGHPYAGSIYHSFARSSGLTYWAALAYDFAGSALWEVAGETTAPSRNDMITTTFAGSFLGEALFRTAHFVLADGGDPNLGQEVLATLTSPPVGVNRLLFGDRFDGLYPSHDPAVHYALSVGMRRNEVIHDAKQLSDVQENRAMAGFAIDYGLPGKAGYEYDRPFDYFHFEATATTSGNALPENIIVRGLLLGTDYDSGSCYDGVWGLYGTYDYFAPEIFKVSSTGVGLGTTGQYLISDAFALQGTVEGGVGFTAVGSTADRPADRVFRYGFSPQGVLALRFAWSDIAMIDFTVNDFLVGAGTSSSSTTGSENIMRAQLGLTLRVYEGHAVGIQWVESLRDPSFEGLPPATERLGAISVFYTFLGDKQFGIVRKGPRSADR